MKKLNKLMILSAVLSAAMIVGAHASGEATADPSADPAASNSASVVKSVTGMTPSDYEYLTNYSNRKTPGAIYVEHDETGTADISLNETVIGEGFTAVYAHGEEADVTVSGKLTLLDGSDGRNASDFSGQGSATVAYDGADLTLKDFTYYSEGFERGVVVVSQDSTVTIEDSDITIMGANPLTEAYEGYHSSADQNYMISPPWCLGLYGGGRILNMIGTTPKLIIKDSVLTGGETWGLLSTDSGSNMTIVVVDSELTALPESKGGSDSGWRIFGYDPDAYGSAYGAYYIGSPTQYYYGAQINGVTYAGIITGAEKGVYTSSNGTIEMTDASGEPLGTVEGKGRPTVINGVFGFMQHNSISDGIYVEDGTIVNTADAIVIYKAANGSYVFDNAVLNSKKGVLFQMIDNDDDSRIGGNPMSVEVGFDENYSDSKIASSGIGFPGVNYAVEPKTGGNDVTVTYSNGAYCGNIYNGTGYYGQTADNLTVNLGDYATLNGDIALTSTIKGVPYSPAALDGIAYYGDDIKYVLLDAEGNANAGNDGTAAYIQITDYTINEYFLQGHVENMNYFNGASTISVNVSGSAVWNVSSESLITSLTIADGAVVKGDLTMNADGSLTLTAGHNIIPAGTYGGSVTAVGGGTTVGGGIDASGELNVGAALDAMTAEQNTSAASSDPVADNTQSASGEPSAEAASSASSEPAAESAQSATAEPSVTTASIAAALIATSLSNEAPAASAEPAAEASAEPSGEASSNDAGEGSKAIVVIGGKEFTLDVYTIDGSQYVKLSDMASLFSGNANDNAGVTWSDYQEYLIAAAGGNAPNLDEFKAQVYALSSWEDIDLTVSPWDMLFTTVGISTWDAFVEAGGNGAASQVTGSMG